MTSDPNTKPLEADEAAEKKAEEANEGKPSGFFLDTENAFEQRIN